MSAYQYIVIVRPSNCTDALETSNRISAALSKSPEKRWVNISFNERTDVWQTGEKSGSLGFTLTDHPHGFILGRIFRKANPSNFTDNLNMLDVDRYSPPTGDSDALVQDCWGTYVFFRIEEGKTIVFRDPTGGLPCYFVSIHGLKMFFSNLTDVRQFIEVPIRASSKFNEVFALMPRLPKSIIGVDGVNQILPAQETIFRSSSAQSSFPWTPWKGHTAEPINNRALAMAELRQSIFQTVAQLSHSNETILHSLGGLDSAIVLGALANSRQSTKVIAYNGFTGAPAGDERVFARAAAQFTSTSLHEIFLDPRRVNLRSVLEWPHQPNPVAYFDCTGPAGNVYELAKQVGANSLWNGVGGDNVFFQLPDIIAALEIVGTGASMSQIFRVALDGARYGRQSFWHVISNMVKERVKPPNRNAVLQFFTPRFRLPFLNDDIVQAGMQTKFLHPLLQAPDGTRNAKYYHVLTTCCFAIDLYDPWQFISGGPKPLERISPLLAQPVVETCLRIAPWLFIDGGMDRGLARKALASVLSQTTAGRTSKSNPDALYDEVTRANSLFIRETLLDGLLVRDGILKRRTLECNFNSDGSLSIDALRVALDLFNWEAWTRSVQNQN